MNKGGRSPKVSHLPDRSNIDYYVLSSNLCFSSTKVFERLPLSVLFCSHLELSLFSSKSIVSCHASPGWIITGIPSPSRTLFTPAAFDKMASFYSSFLLSLLLLLRTAWSLEVTPGSSCSAYCMDPESSDPLSGSSSSTNTSKIVCRDEDFSSTENGLNFKSCIECLQKSQKVNDTENDVAWLVCRWLPDTDNL